LRVVGVTAPEWSKSRVVAVCDPRVPPLVAAGRQSRIHLRRRLSSRIYSARFARRREFVDQLAQQYRPFRASAGPSTDKRSTPSPSSPLRPSASECLEEPTPPMDVCMKDPMGHLPQANSNRQEYKMKKFVPTIMAITFASSTMALAQTSAPPMPAPTAPAERQATPPTVSVPAPSSTKLSDAQTKAWIDKTIYSSDNKNVGEVAAINRDASGNVVDLHADIGGFLGLGETRVRVMPDQFSLAADRVMLKLTAEQVKALPKLAK
jgi:hypothetical protein